MSKEDDLTELIIEQLKSEKETIREIADRAKKKLSNQEGDELMAAAEDRQAKALQEIAHHNKELVKVVATLNDNLVKMFKYIKNAIKNAIEKEDERFREDLEASAEASNNPNQMTLDEIRAQAEKIEKLSREQCDKQSNYEDSLRPGVTDPFETKDETTHSAGVGIELGSPVHSKSYGIYGTVTELHADQAKVVFSHASSPVWVPKSDLTVQLPKTTFKEPGEGPE